MITEAMITRAQALVDKKEIEYHHTDGNAHIFIGQGHSGREDKQYEIKAVIEQNNQIEWLCDCHHAQFNDECKHRLACQILMKELKLRDEYKALSSDNDVVGTVSLQIESDDD